MKLPLDRILIGAGGAIVVVAVLVAALLLSQTPDRAIGESILPERTPIESGGFVDYTLPEGASAEEIGADLYNLGVIRSARQFQVLVALMGLQSNLSAGDYRLQKGSPVALVIDSLTVQDGVPTLRVTFPEGFRIEQMAQTAEKAGFGTAREFLDAVAAATLPAELAANLPPGQGLQGYLFPDTYILPVGSTPADLVALMIETFDTRFSPRLRAAAAARGLNTHQAVTLASIIEREAVLDSERARIAGVFYNRLAAGDTLGADPTTQFAVALDPKSVEEFGWWKLELTDADLRNPSPYNTRAVAGMPPGPIANPGLASLEAASEPEITSFYYFVANAKKADGSHVFAVTLDEHERNKVLYGQ